MACGLYTLGIFPESHQLQNLLDDLTRWCKYSWRCEDLGAIRPPPPGPLTGDDWEADEETSEVDQDDAEADEELAVADGGTPDQVLAALRRRRGRDVKYPVVAAQTALANLLLLQASLPTDGCPTVACGLSTLGLFPKSFQWAELQAEMTHWCVYSVRCEDLGPLRPPPAGPLKGDEWEADSESEHFKQRLAIGLTSSSLYASLAVMSGRGQLDKCHLTSLPLKDANVPISIVAHRVHCLPFSSGFNVNCPSHLDQYRDSSRNFLVESKASNWRRGSYDGTVLLNNIHGTLPWVMKHLELSFSSSVAAAIHTQLQEVYDDPAKLVSRARSMDVYILKNGLNEVQLRALWKRFYGPGSDLALASAMDKIQRARRRAERHDTDLDGVLETSAEWSNEQKMRGVDAHVAKRAVKGSTFAPPAGVLRSRVLTGKSVTGR